MTWRPSTPARVAGAVLAISFALKLTVFLTLYPRGHDRILGQDTPSYERPALALLYTGRFAIDPEHPDVPATLVPPGYPAFIAAIYAAVGERRDAVIVAQIALSLVTLWLTFWTGSRLWGPAAGLFAMGALALDVLSFTYAQILFAETLFTALLAIACYAAVEHLLTGRLKWAAACAVALAATALVRPITYYLFWPLLVGMLVRQWRVGVSARALLTTAGVMAAIWVVLVGGWRLRNARVAGHAQLSDIQAVNLLFFRAAGVVALRDGISFYDAQRKIVDSLPDLSGKSRGEIAAIYQREAIHTLLANPALLLRTEAFGVVKIVAGSGRGEMLHYFGNEPYESEPAGAVGLSVVEMKSKFAGRAWVLIPVIWVFAHLAVLYAGALVGLRKAWTRAGAARAPALLLAGVAAYMVLIATGPEAYARFRVPVMPIVVLLGASGFVGTPSAGSEPDAGRLAPFLA